MDEIDLIEEFFGEELSPDLISVVSSADYTALHEFQAKTREFETTYRLPNVERDEYRPYIAVDALHYGELSHGLLVGQRTRFYETSNPEDLFRAADRLQHHLLYSHSVVLNSPLGFITDLFSSGRSFTFEEWRAYLANYVSFLTYIKPLVRERIVYLLPRAARSAIRNDLLWTSDFDPKPVLTDTERTELASQSDFSSLLPYVSEEYLDNPLARVMNVKAAERSILMTAIEERERGSRLDLYMPHDYFVDVLKQLLPRMERVRQRKGLHLASMRLRELLRIDLPKLDDLRPDDIVSLRRDEVAFASWRTALSRALERIRSLDLDLSDRDSESRSIVVEELNEASTRVNETLSRQSFGSRVRAGARPFALGAVGALATAALVPPGPAIAAGAITTAADLLLGWLGSEPADAQQAFRRHFAVFQA